MLDDKFLIEEYKSKWEYVRHTETIRIKFIGWYYLISGVLVAFLVRDRQLNIEDHFNKLQQNQDVKISYEAVIVLSFLVILGISLNLFMIAQKTNYSRYTKRLNEIESSKCDYNPTYPKSNLIATFKTIFYNVNILITAEVFLLCVFIGLELIYIIPIIILLICTFVYLVNKKI